ncbi:MAG: fumarylacetoacetate hydrolase family protein [Bacteroidales bacterium]|nr:fumarylacetoacetate hydrolase family protein [Bacteroidales bacterium]
MKIICVGRNYVEHIQELGNEKPDSIVFFMKPDTALLKDGEDFYLPDFSQNVAYECELVVKISKVGKTIPVAFAKNYYEQVTLGLDITLRDVQQKAKEKGLPWTLAKAFDYSAPIGNFLPLKSLNKDIQDLNFTLKKNGETVQSANTSLMINKVDEIIAYVSKFITLKTGDYIFTGTPKGVGPMNIGDVFTAYLEGEQVLKVEVK